MRPTLPAGLMIAWWLATAGTAMGQDQPAPPARPPTAEPRRTPQAPAPATGQPARPAPAPTPTPRAPSTPRAAPAPTTGTPAARPVGPGTLVATPSTIPPTTGYTPPPTGGFAELESFSTGGIPQMIGDQGPGLLLRQFANVPSPPPVPTPFPPPTPPGAPAPRTASAVVPSVRTFKVAENMSPAPQDRIFFSFNYFADLNGAINQRLGSPITNLRAYRELFGFEKTFNDANGSFGIRLPVDTLTANTRNPTLPNQPGGTNTAVGDLSVFGKYVLWSDRATGSLLSGGLVVSAPTGPNRYAGAPGIASINDTTFQPFLGYIWKRDRFYVHGFFALDVPTLSRDVTLMYNDIGIGYFLYRAPDPQNAFVTSFVPTFEVHVNDPLNHRNFLNPRDPVGTPDWVDFTYGANVQLLNRSILTFGFVTPVTGPRPFAYEALVQLNFFFGGKRRPSRPMPPLIGG